MLKVSKEDLRELDQIKINKLYLDRYNFLTENSKDINIKLIKYAEDTIDRMKSRIELIKLLNDSDLAIEIEKGLFEFSLIQTTIKNYEYNITPAIYDDKIYDIISNIKDNDTGLIEKIRNNLIKPYFIAFLSPQQLNPKAWEDILKKKKYIEDKQNNMAFSDLYLCHKCKSRKCKVTELQIRSVDEPATKFITCLVCYSTWTK